MKGKKALSFLKAAVGNSLREKKMRGQYSVVWDNYAVHPKLLNNVSESSEKYQA